MFTSYIHDLLFLFFGSTGPNGTFLVLDKMKDAVFKVKLHHPIEIERIAVQNQATSIAFDGSSGRLYIATSTGLM